MILLVAKVQIKCDFIGCYRFRHAAVSTLMGGAKLRSMAAQRNPKMADVVSKMQTLHEAVKQGKPPEGKIWK